MPNINPNCWLFSAVTVENLESLNWAATVYLNAKAGPKRRAENLLRFIHVWYQIVIYWLQTSKYKQLVFEAAVFLTIFAFTIYRKEYSASRH